MVRRTLTALLLLLVLVPAVYIGGIPFFLLVAAFAGTAAWEYCQMFRLKAFEPSGVLVVGAVFIVIATRAFRPEWAGIALTLSVLGAMVFHLFRFERGRGEAAVDLAIALAGIVYLGWVTAYLIDVRLLPNGLWWLLLVLVTVWVADSAAYFVGVRFGRHKMFARLSPKKSWEGYAAGGLAGTAIAGILGYWLGRLGIPDLSIWQSVSLGIILSIFTTLGDLGESLFKRFAGIKDSGSLLPGHGGAFDRIDSLIWAGVLGYSWIRCFLK